MSLKIEAEIKLESEPCVLAWENELFAGTEDGCIKSFDAKLNPKQSWTAHAVQPFALATGNGYIYSSSNDGAIRVWSPLGQKITELQTCGADVGALLVFDSLVYAGDEDGNIMVYESNNRKAWYNVLEEVKCLCLNPPYLFTARDLYVTVTEIKPEESKTRFMTRHNIEGRAPVKITNNRLVFTSRTGNNLCLHDLSIDTTFEKLDEAKVSDMIVNTLAANGNYVWTGSWDGLVRRWDITGDKLKAVGEINLGGCINSLVTDGERAYAAVAGGKIVHITVI